MGQAAAKQGDKVQATDMHMVVVPGPPPQSLLLPNPFSGTIDGGLSSNVNIDGKPAAVVGSSASNTPAHIVPPPGTNFVKPPLNKGTIFMGSQTVFINAKPAARNGDTVVTCNDPADLPNGKIIAVGTVMIG